jgi:cytochrome P450
MNVPTQAVNLPEAYPFSHLFQMQRQGMMPFYLDLWHRHGNYIRKKMGPLQSYMITHPEHVRHVLVKNVENYTKGVTMAKLKAIMGNGLFVSEGDLWLRQRRLMQPLFTPRGVTRYTDLMVNVAQEMVERWSPENPVPVNAEMMRLAMSVIGRAMFGVDAGENQAEIGQAFSDVLEFASQRTITLIDPPLFIPTPTNQRFKRSLALIDQFLYGIIRKRRQSVGEEGDLIAQLLKAEDETTGTTITDQQLRDEVVTIFFAGHETTAQTLTWVWYLLATHPDVEARLHEELSQVLGGRQPVLEDLHQLNYARWVVEETMRLYPPVWIMARQAVAADRIGDQTIEPNAMVVVLIYGTHRLPEYWESPEVFKPERFAPEQSEGRPQHAYLPFGAGPRICIGNNFALLEATLALATAAQQVRLRLTSDQPLKAVGMGTLRPAHEIMMRVERR